MATTITNRPAATPQTVTTPTTQQTQQKKPVAKPAGGAAAAAAAAHAASDKAAAAKTKLTGSTSGSGIDVQEPTGTATVPLTAAQQQAINKAADALAAAEEKVANAPTDTAAQAALNKAQASFDNTVESQAQQASGPAANARSASPKYLNFKRAIQAAGLRRKIGQLARAIGAKRSVLGKISGNGAQEIARKNSINAQLKYLVSIQSASTRSLSTIQQAMSSAVRNY